MRIAVGADHAGFELKERVKRALGSMGHQVQDMGTGSSESVDYPQFAFRVAEAVRDGAADLGVLICDSGNGIAIAANKVAGVRAALCVSPAHATMARRHNDANVLVLGSAILPQSDEVPTLEAWLKTEFEGGRHARRIGQITDYERDHIAR